MAAKGMVWEVRWNVTDSEGQVGQLCHLQHRRVAGLPFPGAAEASGWSISSSAAASRVGWFRIGIRTSRRMGLGLSIGGKFLALQRGLAGHAHRTVPLPEDRFSLAASSRLMRHRDDAESVGAP